MIYTWDSYYSNVDEYEGGTMGKLASQLVGNIENALTDRLVKVRGRTLGIYYRDKFMEHWYDNHHKEYMAANSYNEMEKYYETRVRAYAKYVNIYHNNRCK